MPLSAGITETGFLFRHQKSKSLDVKIRMFLHNLGKIKVDQSILPGKIRWISTNI
jgi:hypothetical protein